MVSNPDHFYILFQIESHQALGVEEEEVEMTVLLGDRENQLGVAWMMELPKVQAGAREDQLAGLVVVKV